MIYLSTTHPPSTNPDAISCADTIGKFCAQYPGFPGYVLMNPTQPGSTGDGMAYPDGLYGPDWKAACESAKAAGGVLIPRIGGCATHDLPPKDGAIDTLAKRFRPSPQIWCDYANGSDAQTECERYRRVFEANGQTFCPEANAKRTYTIPAATCWPVAEWFLWDMLVASSVSGWNQRRWKVREVLDNTAAKVIVEVTSIERHDCGFVNGCTDWPAAKVEIAKAFNAIDPQRIIVSVRPAGMSPAQVAAMRSLNA